MSTIGYVQFVIWIAIVLAISIFTLDLVCNLSQWAGCYKALYVDNKNVDIGLLNRKGIFSLFAIFLNWGFLGGNSVESFIVAKMVCKGDF